MTIYSIENIEIHDENTVYFDYKKDDNTNSYIYFMDETLIRPNEATRPEWDDDHVDWFFVESMLYNEGDFETIIY